MIDKNKLLNDLSALRAKSPLVHNITNYVVMNNTANAVLAIGASPVMAHALEEMEEMTSIAGALVINIGTLDATWVEAMLLAGKTALKKQIPMILDPVGAGATTYRTKVCWQLIKECKPTIIRGNASEITALVNSDTKTKGVDSLISSSSALEDAKALATQTGTIVVISGPTDYITDGKQVAEVPFGSTMMTKVTGLGCTASALTGAFAAINSNPFEASLHAMAVMSIAGERAARRSQGTGSMQVNFLDELYNLSEKEIGEFVK